MLLKLKFWDRPSPAVVDPAVIQRLRATAVENLKDAHHALVEWANAAKTSPPFKDEPDVSPQFADEVEDVLRRYVGFTASVEPSKKPHA